MKFNKENLVKSPLNYTGGKYKLLGQILPLFPDNINTFVDLFTGGCNVGVNVNANKIICNDYESSIIDLYNNLKNLTPNKALNYIDNTIEKYQLSKTNKEGYYLLREEYNSNKKYWYMFYSLVAYSFNNQIRFNKKGEFNMPFGKNRSSFNARMRKNFEDFINRINNINIHFTNYNFRDLKIDKLDNNDFIYCDPPYLVTCATYNENDGWNEEKERELLQLLDNLNNKGIRFALSNVLEHNGRENIILKEWCKKYNIHYLNYSYTNCSYNKKANNKRSIEVLITNY